MCQRDQKYSWLELGSLKVNLFLSNVQSGFVSDLGFGLEDEHRKGCICLVSKQFCSAFLLQAPFYQGFYFGSFLQRLGKTLTFSHSAFHTVIVSMILEVLGYQVTRRDKMKLYALFFFSSFFVRGVRGWGGAGNLRERMFSHASKDRLRASSDLYGSVQSLSFSICPSAIIKTMC